MEKLDIHEAGALARRDREMLQRKNITAPDLTGRPRIQLGKAIFFYRTDGQKKKSVVHRWDKLRLNQNKGQ